MFGWSGALAWYDVPGTCATANAFDAPGDVPTAGSKRLRQEMLARKSLYKDLYQWHRPLESSVWKQKKSIRVLLKVAGGIRFFE